MNTYTQNYQKHIKTLALCGIMSALAVVLALYTHFPLFSAASFLGFLEYDAADVPLFLLSALCGPWYALAATAVASVIQGLTVSAGGGWIGIVMHIFGTGSFILGQNLLLGRDRFLHLLPTQRMTQKRHWIATGVGVAAMLCAMALWNLILTPIYMKIPLSELLEYYPLILLFNLVKGGNGVLSMSLLSALFPFLKKGRWL